MACGGFACSKNALIALNVLYVLVAFILIGVASTARAMAIVTNLSLVGGIIACGVFLLLVAIIGLAGAARHHQVLLFFYMIILFLVFLIQFAVACACLAFNSSQQVQLARKAWSKADKELKNSVQSTFQCCGYDKLNQDNCNSSSVMGHPACNLTVAKCEKSSAFCCTGVPPPNGTHVVCPVTICLDAIRDKMDAAFKGSGAVGLLFSFTEILGVWLTVRYRNQKDPRANPSAFL